jgi:Fe-S cluster assembly protein SufD
MSDLQQLRNKAADDFERLGFPTTKEELWRFTDVSPLAKQEFSSAWTPASIEFEPLGRYYLVFENGKLSSEKSNVEGLPEGVRVGSIMDQADARLGMLADAQSAFVAANTAYFSDGAYIEIDDGVELDSPIHLVYLADADASAFQLRNLVSAGKDSQLTVVEQYIGAAGKIYWTNVVTEVFVSDHATVDHYKINHAITLGSGLGRNDIRGKLTGEGGEAICNGLYLLKEKQVFDTHMFMDHAVPKCNSHELYKGILDEKARAVFCGRILVQQDAQQTDAVQSNRNLLLSRGAKVNTLPQLEIYADDVKCTHGATIGELDEVALYYLQTRGIDPVQGHAMLTYAFANEVLDEVKCAPVKAYVEQLVHAWLEEASV